MHIFIFIFLVRCSYLVGNRYIILTLTEIKFLLWSVENVRTINPADNPPSTDLIL